MANAHFYISMQMNLRGSQTPNESDRWVLYAHALDVRCSAQFLATSHKKFIHLKVFFELSKQLIFKYMILFLLIEFVHLIWIFKFIKICIKTKYWISQQNLACFNNIFCGSYSRAGTRIVTSGGAMGGARVFILVRPILPFVGGRFSKFYKQ